MRNAFPSLSLDLEVFPARPDILVAGCGTGQSLLFAALGYDSYNMLGVDLSLSSLAFAQRKLDELGVEDVRLMQGDILELGELDERFDVIECTGVLHHLSNPIDGWNTLYELLRPGGFMHVALYSNVARRNIARIQDGLAKKGCGTSAEQIRNCRHALIRDIPQLGQMLSSFHDFYCVSGFRDMFLHAQEHRYTIPQVKEVLADLNLDFLGFVSGGEELVEPYRAASPDDPEMRSIDNWHEFEMAHPDTFIRMYRFWVRKSL